MKKRVVFISVVVCVMVGMFSLSASAQSLHIGIGGGAYLPTGDAEEIFTISPGIHGTLLMGIKNILKFDGELGYWILQESSDFDSDDFSASYYVATGGLRFYPAPSVHLDAGLGAYKASFEWRVAGMTAKDSDTYGGVYGGLGLELGALDIKVRAHAPDFDDFYIGGTVTYLFNIKKVTEM